MPGDDDAFRRSLEEDGYALIDFSSDPETLALCDAAWAQSSRWHEGGYNRVQDAWRRAPSVRGLASLEAVTGRLAAAYGAKPFPFQTLSFHYGSQQAPHADIIHFTPDPAHLMCGVWFALEDVHEDAGPLVYFPGSHRLPALTLDEAGAPAGMAPYDAYRLYYEPAMSERLADFPKRLALLRKGQAFVWAANLAHGGLPRRNPALTRRSLVTHYFFENCQYYTLMLSRNGAARHVRLPGDAATGRFMWPREPRGLSLRTLAQACRDRVSRAVFRFEA